MLLNKHRHEGFDSLKLESRPSSRWERDRDWWHFKIIKTYLTCLDSQPRPRHNCQERLNLKIVLGWDYWDIPSYVGTYKTWTKRVKTKILPPQNILDMSRLTFGLGLGLGLESRQSWDLQAYCQVISLIGIFWNFSVHFTCFVGVVVVLCFSGLFEVWLPLALWNNQNFSFDWYQFCWYFLGRYCVWSTLLLKKKNKLLCWPTNAQCKVQHWQK